MIRIFVPPQRLTPLKKNWDKIVTTVIENLKLQIRMNTKKKCVEIKTSEHTVEKMALSRATDFVKAFMLGFDLNDAIALLRLDDLYIESFEVKDGNYNFLIIDKLKLCMGIIYLERSVELVVRKEKLSTPLKTLQGLGL